MSGKSENIFITGSQIPNTNEETIQSILDIIKNANTFQDVINTLEEDKLIWYFLRHLLKDHEIQDRINSKWKEEFAGFNKSIDSTAKELKGLIGNQEFLVYPKSDNSLEMRFVADDSKQISVETSSVLRASPEGKTINISLGADSIITATRKIRDKRNERHYDFSNSDSCNMIINWEAKDDQGKLINCSMTLRVGKNGIEDVIGKPKFGGTTDGKKVVELVEQNTEVFINGKPLYKALMSMAQNVSNQQKTGETILPARAEEKDISHLSVDENDSGVVTPSPASSDTESISDYGNDDFENEVQVEEDDHEELEQENKQPKEYNLELEQENEQLKKKNKELKGRNKLIVEEGDDYILQLEESEEQVKLFANKLAKKEDELRKMHKENEDDVTVLEDAIGKLEEDVKDRDNTIRKLENEITRLAGEINRIKKANEELQSQLDESEQEKRRLKIESEKLKKDNQERTSALNGQGEELAESQSELQQPNEELQRQLNDLTYENKNLKVKIEQDRKKNQQPNVNGKSLLDEMSGDGKDEEINELKKQVKEKNEEILKMDTELEQAQKEAKDTREILETLQDQLRQQEGQKATQHEIRTETALPENNKGMQTTMIQQNPIIKELRQENTGLIKDKQTILIKLKQEVKENSGLKQRLKNLQEENEELKQKPIKKETGEFEIQTEGRFRNVFDDQGKYLRTEVKGLPPPDTDLSKTRVNAHSTNNNKKDPSPGP